MSNKVKAAIIGLGWAGCEHLKGYVENPQSEVIAVCDMDEDRARQIAKENNIAPHDIAFPSTIVATGISACLIVA